MKIVALLPVKNEAWILPTYLSSVSKIADEIIALDDSSTDRSREILQSAGVTIIPFTDPDKEVNMSLRRKRLLEEGRRAGGTHFIWLDADEAFSFPFNENGREIINKLQPGEKISLKWITLWKSTSAYRQDGPWDNLYKDFIVCDMKDQGFDDRFLSEARTPGENDRIKKSPELSGVVLHFQFVTWKRALLKQSYYRMREFIEGERSARRINATYSITLDSFKVKTAAVPSDWLKGVKLPPVLDGDSSFYLEKIFAWFDQYGIEFFESLEIWQVPELHQEFIKRMGREPQPKTFPNWLLKLNAWRHNARLSIL